MAAKAQIRAFFIVVAPCRAEAPAGRRGASVRFPLRYDTQGGGGLARRTGAAGGVCPAGGGGLGGCPEMKLVDISDL
jgi:hypothetical protein